MDKIDLIYRCKNQDRKAQETLYRMYKDVLFVLCLKYCQNTADAEDVLQESFISIFENIQKFEPKGSFEGWLKRITIHKAIDKYHNNKVKQFPLQEDTFQIVALEDNLETFPLDLLLKLIQDLPNQYRLVFNLNVMDGYTHKEISQMLHISEGTSKSNLHRAKLILKENILKYQKSELQYG